MSLEAQEPRNAAPHKVLYKVLYKARGYERHQGLNKTILPPTYSIAEPADLRFGERDRQEQLPEPLPHNYSFLHKKTCAHVLLGKTITGGEWY